MRRATQRPGTRTLFALGTITSCTLAVQVVFSRMMGSLLAYHFSFLAISLALLGTGAGSLLIYVRPGWFDRRPLDEALSRWGSIYGALLIISPLALVRLDYSSGNAGVTREFALTLALTCVLAAGPALAAGVVVGLAIRGFADHIGRVYAWDLVGAGIGALVIVPLLRFPAPQLLVGLGALACAASALFALDQAAVRARAGALVLSGIVLIALASATSFLYHPMVGLDADEVTTDIWHPLSRVQTVAQPDGAASVLYYDRVYAPVPHVTGDVLPTWQDLRLGPSSIGYELTGPGHALVIGGGGGRDIYNALTSDQTVDVIELNSAIRDAVEGSLGRWSGSPYSRPGVSTTIGDGRAILADRDTEYDQIHMGFTDTLSASAAQGFALSENNLYTLEAFDEYLDHLAPRGVLNVSRLERLVGDEAIRITVLTMAALERQGIEDPARHMVVIRGTDAISAVGIPYMTVLARLEPFTAEEVVRIRVLAEERGEGTAFIPGGPYYGAWADLAEAPSWKSFCDGYPLDVCPPTDDKPFFFNMQRLGDVLDSTAGYHYSVDPYRLLLLTLLILFVLSVVGLLLPLRLARTDERPPVTSLLYFAAIGLGFLLLETVLIQRFVLFLGYPTYALSVVLSALLIFTGVGSAISARFRQRRATLVAVLGVLTLWLVVGSFALSPLLRSLIDVPFGGRVLLTVAILAPFGIGLGMPMPLGLARFSGPYPSSIPYAWGINGIASVLASVLGVVVAIRGGYVVASLLAAACYAFALGHALLGAWSSVGQSPPASAPDERTDEVDARVDLVTG